MNMTAAGRRPGENATREEIVVAARKLFAENGYDRTTVRAIGAAAGVNAAMVHYFFGSKEQVFVAALELPVNPAQVVPVLLDGPREQFGQRMAGFLMSLWTSPQTRPALLAMLRSVVSNEQAASMMREFFNAVVIERAADTLGVPRFRLAAAAGQAVGLMWFRFVVAIEPLAVADDAQIAEQLATMIQYTIDRD
jgi:AcrR family transcriptional regulator